MVCSSLPSSETQCGKRDEWAARRESTTEYRERTMNFTLIIGCAVVTDSALNGKCPQSNSIERVVVVERGAKR